MSTRNSLANKTIRRAERVENADRQEKKRMLQDRMIELMLEPPVEEPRVSELVIAESVLWTPEEEKNV